MDKLEEKFTAELNKRIGQAKLLGIPFPRLEKEIARSGGVRAMKGLLSRSMVSEGFDRLAESKKLALAPEALVAEGAYGDLFTDDEVNFCFEQLCEQGYFNLK